MLAKICKIIPLGYSKSLDKVRTMIYETKKDDLLQFMDDYIQEKKRYLVCDIEVEEIKEEE